MGLGRHLEWLSRPGNPEKPNEDRCIALSCGEIVFLAVADGATGGAVTPEGVSGAALAAQAAIEAAGRLGLRSSPLETLLAANRAVRATMLRHFGSYGLTGHTTLTCCRVDLEAGRAEFAHAGDTCLLGLPARRAAVTLTTDQVAETDRRLLERALALGVERGLPLMQVRQLPEIRASLDEQRRRLNTPEGFPCLNGDPTLEGYVQAGSLPLAPYVGLAILSDGLVPPTTLEPAPEDALMIACALRRGLETLYGGKRAREEGDPDCERYPRFKPSDDATGVLLHWG